MESLNDPSTQAVRGLAAHAPATTAAYSTPGVASQRLSSDWLAKSCRHLSEALRVVQRLDGYQQFYCLDCGLLLWKEE